MCCPLPFLLSPPFFLRYCCVRERLFGTGSSTNAYTDFHHTVFYASCPVLTPPGWGRPTPMLGRALGALLDVLEVRDAALPPCVVPSGWRRSVVTIAAHTKVGKYDNSRGHSLGFWFPLEAFLPSNPRGFKEGDSRCSALEREIKVCIYDKHIYDIYDEVLIVLSVILVCLHKVLLGFCYRKHAPPCLLARTVHKFRTLDRPLVWCTTHTAL